VFNFLLTAKVAACDAGLFFFTFGTKFDDVELLGDGRNDFNIERGTVEFVSDLDAEVRKDSTDNDVGLLLAIWLLLVESWL
jgi:hypothetical protein